MDDTGTIRLKCLEFAITMRQVGNTAASIIDNAKAFETYVTPANNILPKRRGRRVKADKV